MWERDEEERMASGYDGHHAKRQRTEDGPRGRVNRKQLNMITKPLNGHHYHFCLFQIV